MAVMNPTQQCCWNSSLKTLKEAQPNSSSTRRLHLHREREALVYLVFKLPAAIAKKDLRTKKLCYKTSSTEIQRLGTRMCREEEDGQQS
jgi:hypothetical protein